MSIKRKLDTTRDFSRVYGNPPVFFEQDGIQFNHWGDEILPPEPFQELADSLVKKTVNKLKKEIKKNIDDTKSGEDKND
jgi:hypothetical protein